MIPSNPSDEDIAGTWEQTQRERQAILVWGRQGGRLQEVVQAYRFARRQGDSTETAKACAVRVVGQIDPTIAEAATYALVLLEWMEREHRDWFWRCCRHHHVL